MSAPTTPDGFLTLPSAPPARRLGSTRRTVCLWVVGALACLVMTLTTVFGLAAHRMAAQDLRGRALPASVALNEASGSMAASQVLLMDAVQTDDPAAKSAAIVAADAENHVQVRAWDAYLGLAVGGPDELALQEAFLDASGRSRDLAAQLLSLPADDPTRPDVLNAEQKAAAEGVTALETIEASIYAGMLSDDAARLEVGIQGTRTNALKVGGALAALFTGLAALMLRGARRDERVFNHEAKQLRLAGEAATLEGSLQRGLEMAQTEEAAYGIVHQALTIVASDSPTELLLADSSQAHFRQAISTSASPDDACSVSGPSQCPAANSGQTWVFEDSTQLDACPHLRGNTEPVWATCVPVSIGGRATGVLHSQRPLDQARPDRLTTGLELVARKTGERIAAVRILAKSEAEAQVDALTGLPNRRTLENQVSDLRIADDPFVVAFADLDHFKGINDAHGHDTGDRALRLFARVLRESVRPRDLVARLGGEEFVVVFPDCSLADARDVAERIRSELGRTLVNATVPPFTVTIGLAAAEPGDQLADVTAHADAAMLRGKTLGRDRVLVIGDEVAGSPARPVAVPYAS